MALTRVSTIGIATGISLTGVTTTQDTKVGSGITLSPDGDGYYTGVVTATSYRGDVSNCTGVGQTNFIDAETLNVSGVSTLGGNTTIAGITTINSSLQVGTGITLSPDGEGYYTGVSTISINATNTHPFHVVNSNAGGHGIWVKAGDSATDFSLLIEDKDANNLFEVMGDGEVHIERQALMPKAGFNVTAGVSTFQADISMVDKIVHTGDLNTAIRFPANDEIQLETGGAGRFLINSTGQTLIGSSVEQMSGSEERPLQVHSINGPKIAIGRNDTSITDGNTIGGLEFYGNDANGTFVNTAGIIVNADGTHGDNDKPTRIQFYTTADNASSSTEHMRIMATGDVSMGPAGNAVYDDITGGAGLVLGGGSVSNAGIMIRTSSSGTGRIYFGDNSGDDNGRKDGHITYNQTDRALVFGTAQAERLRIDSSGHVLAGNYFTSQAIGNYTSYLQIQGTSADASSMSIFRYTNDDGGSNITLGKGRGTSGGSATKPNASDTIGSIRFAMATNSDLVNGTCARIDCIADGTPSGGDYPSRISFWTTPDGTATPVETVRMKANGSLLCKGKYNSQSGSAFMEIGNSYVALADESTITLSSAANTGVLISIGVNKGATGSITYDHGLFWCSYGVANSVEVADGGGDFSNSDTDGYMCVYSSGGSANVTVKNRLGHTTNVSIGMIRFIGN